MTSSLKDSVERVLSEKKADALLSHSNKMIEARETQLHCLLGRDEEFLLSQVQALQTRIDSGASPDELPLAGVPVVIKDNICVDGQTTTCGSKMLESFVPPYDATVWERLREAGALLVGKANMDEFAMGSSTENSAFGKTSNPWDIQRVPGGSSGGSAAAVGAEYAPVALGSDTGGSIRQPAAFCGVTGLKPTYGRVSRYGLVAFASSLDQIGPITHTAVDCSRAFAVIAGFDKRDATSSDREVERGLFDLESVVSLKNVKLAIPSIVDRLLSEECKASFEATVETFRSLGVTVDRVELPHLEASLAAYYVIAPAEASSNLARYDGVRYGAPKGAPDYENVAELTRKTRSQLFGPEVKRRIMLGTYTLSAGYFDAYYNRAQKVRTALRNSYDEIFKDYTAVLTPTTPGPAFKLGEKSSDPVAMYLSDVFTVSANLTGLPALSLPGGFLEGLPLGIQLLGPGFSELNLLTLARDFQSVTDFHQQRPKL